MFLNISAKFWRNSSPSGGFPRRPDRAALLKDWRAWVDLLARDDVDARSDDALRLADVLLRLLAAAADADASGAAPALAGALPALAAKFCGEPALAPRVFALARVASESPSKDAGYVAAAAATLRAVPKRHGAPSRSLRQTSTARFQDLLCAA